MAFLMTKTFVLQLIKSGGIKRVLHCSALGAFYWAPYTGCPTSGSPTSGIKPIAGRPWHKAQLFHCCHCSALLLPSTQFFSNISFSLFNTKKGFYHNWQIESSFIFCNLQKQMSVKLFKNMTRILIKIKICT